MINCFQYCINFAFKFNLRRYNAVTAAREQQRLDDVTAKAAASAASAAATAAVSAAFHSGK